MGAHSKETIEAMREFLQNPAFFDFIPMDWYLSQLSTEERLKGLTFEERFDGLTLEEWINGLNKEERDSLRQALLRDKKENQQDQLICHHADTSYHPAL